MRNVLSALLAVVGLVVFAANAHACNQNKTVAQLFASPPAAVAVTGSHIECVPDAAPLAIAAPVAVPQFATIRQTVPVVSYAIVEQQVAVAPTLSTVATVQQASLRTRRLAELRAEHHERRAAAHLKRAAHIRTARAKVRACSTSAVAVVQPSALASESVRRSAVAAPSQCPPGTHPVLVPDGQVPVAPQPGLPAPGDLQ